ncbi:MAG: hypothetical protein RIC15_12880 [Vicingaceae bacterium]
MIFFFPVQLFWIQLKKTQTILVFWALLFGLVTRGIALKYGIPHLFLYPEYMGHVNFLSHLLLGFSCGVFIMSYNISAYIMIGYRFPFIATLSRPFLKFCYNNSLIPWAFTIVYLWNMVDFQMNVELEPVHAIGLNLMGFLAGNLIFIFFSTIYFLGTNKNILEFSVGPKQDRKSKSGVSDFIHRPGRWDRLLNRTSNWRIETYLSNPFKFALARSSGHYDRDTLQKVFSQNHFNASLFEITCVLAILLIGWFKDVAWLSIPASASIFLLFSIVLMLTSALHSWVKGWALTVFLVIFFGLHLATKNEWIDFTNEAYGLNYKGNKANYHEEFLNEIARDKYDREEDFEKGIEILENWKKKAVKGKSGKPKLIIINTSGGGLRSMMWTTLGMLRIDESLEGKLMKNLQLITGSSGGMIGASYVRELYLNDLQPENFRKEIDFLSDKVSRDILNPITLNLVTSDLFYKFQRFEDGGYTYYKDRAYAFENTLNENVSHLFEKRLSDYAQPEYEARIPMMIFAPTIINDGRRLIISAQDVSYMMNNDPMPNLSNTPILESIEYRKFFKEQGADNVRFSSILRMNATFPYILPAVSLPSVPAIKIMDAGIRDNYGVTTSLKYLYTFRKWITENTSGVIMLQLRDKLHRYEVKGRGNQSFLKNITSPLDNFYSNWTNVQTFEQDQLMQYASSWFDGQLDVVYFQLKNDPSQQISLSWHLTGSEKKRIKESLFIEQNNRAVERLIMLMSND